MVNDTGYIAYGIGSTGAAVTVSGIDAAGGPSTWTNTRDLVVGQFGTGSLSILSGGSVSNLVGYVGASPGGQGTVIISGRAANGAISTWTNAGNLRVGDQGTGNLTVENGGALKTGATTYIGNSATGRGTVIVRGQDASGNASTWVSAGNLAVGQAGTGTLTIDPGGLVQVGGNVTIAASKTATGTLNLVGTTAGRGILETGSLIKGVGSASLHLDGGILRATRDEPNFLSGFTNLALSSGGAWFDTNAHDIGMDTAFSGSSDIAKLGLGKLTLTGDSSTFTGTTRVEAGTLAVNGVVGGTMVVSNGRLQGVGTVGATTIAAGGIHSPGNSIGTQTIAGNYINHGTLQIEANPTAADKLIVTGGVDIAGATLVLDLSPATADSWSPLNGPFTIIDKQSIGAVTGIFASINNNLIFLDATVNYAGGDGNDVTLALARNDIAFASIGQTFNQIGTAGGIESLPNTSPVWHAIALTADPKTARAAFDQLSGEIHASAKTSLIEDSRFVREAINDRIRTAFVGVGADQRPVLAYAWGSVFGAWGSTDGDGNAARLDHSTSGFVTGFDGFAAENMRLGVMAGYSHSSFHADDRASSGSSENYHLGLYGGTQMGALGFRSGLAYTWHKVSTGRSVAFPGFPDSLSADYDAGTTQAFGELGYRIDTPSASFEPFANLAYVNLHSGGLAEKGGAAALTSTSQTTDATFTTLGVRASIGFAVGASNATARGMLGWKHAFGDIVPLATHAFAGSNAFTVAGAPIARNAAVIEGGLDFDISPMAKLGASYIGDITSTTRNHGVKVDLSVRF